MESIYAISDTYPSLLRTIYAVNDKLKKDGIMAPTDLSIANTRRLYELIGKPLDRIPTVHVGGTNGKGSTCFKIAKALQQNGLKTGLFVSPHLASFRERVQVNSDLIPESSCVRHLQVVLKLCSDNNIPATLFEITFLLACLHYQSEECDVVVLEVGLGGELDATNVVSTCLSVIASVSLDHTRILGGTVEEIALKKAGIFKPESVALVGPQCPLHVVQAVAETRRTRLFCLPDLLVDRELTDLIVSLNCIGSGVVVGGDEDIRALVSSLEPDTINALLSAAALSLLKSQGGVFQHLNIRHPAVLDALRLRPPCRWEMHKVMVDCSPSSSSSSSSSLSSASSDSSGSIPAQVEVEVVLDMGHNPAAIAALTRRIQAHFVDRPIRVLYAMSRDKDVKTCLTTLLTVIPSDRIHFAQSDNFRAVTTSHLAKLVEEVTRQPLVQLNAATVRDTVRCVLSLAAQDGPHSVVVICGTGYIMPDSRAELGIVEPRDVDDLKL